ncbi:MAG TPA: GNAT family N-acetyltransferase [Kofleriaceae bacterium]|nr:GNAT family N-acetyltransferase [Kofleriaceae bacterium]
MLPPWPDDVILEEVFVSPRSASLPLPDLRRIERPGWVQLITPSFRTGGFNEVAFSALADDEADAVIDATIAEYRALGIAFRWTVPPGSAPADLAARLLRRGLFESWGRGMARATAVDDAAAAVGEAAADPAITVEEIDASGVETFTRTMAEGWGRVDPAALLRANQIALALPERTHRLFLARLSGEPAGTASYVAFPRSAFLLGAVVLPRFRRRGLYRALALARLAHARARGLELATCHARESTSAPILERLGFATIRRFAHYFSSPP